MRDADVRAAMMQRLEACHRHEVDTYIVQEMGVWSGHVRIDIAVINGELSGFEIKSDRDRLTRLPNQAEIYSRVFDRIELVVGGRHRQKALDLVPAWWGVIVAEMSSNGVVLTEDRPALPNPCLEPLLIAQLLWKDEAIDVLTRRDMAVGWRSKRVSAIHRHVAETLPIDELRADVRSALKARIARSREVVTHLLDVPINPNLDPGL